VGENRLSRQAQVKDRRQHPERADLLPRLYAMKDAGRSHREIAAALGIGVATVSQWANAPRAGEMQTLHGKGFSTEQPVDEIDIDELVTRRKGQFSRKKRLDDAGKQIKVRVAFPGPIGILHLGDPHVDDDGTDIAALEQHTDIVRETDGMFIANVGDTTNNWVGRLGMLYANQSTTAREAWALAEWLFKRMGDKCLYIVGGNHDAWSGSGDPLRWIARDATAAAISKSSEVRIRLQFPVGRDVTINARHDFKGHSLYNPAHGAMKALLQGIRDDIAICGHKHTSGYGVVKNVDNGNVGHAIQVASYKLIDDYAKTGGFRDQHISPCAVTVIDPTADDPADVVQLFWNPERAAKYLRMLRGQS
jgi:hypothetical protein